MKVEARDSFVVGVPKAKNPPALSFIAVSDVMSAFKQVGGPLRKRVNGA